MRIEGTVRVQPTRAGDETDAATNAMDAAARVGDAEMRAAAAVTAAASLNAVPLDVRGDDDDAKMAARRSVRERAMTLVAEAAEGTLSDVAADENFIVEPDVVRAYVSAVAAVSASPEETTKAAAATGVEIVAGVLRAKTARPTPLDVLGVAAAALDAAMTVVAVEGSRSARPNATSDVTGDAASERATTTEWLAAASSGKGEKVVVFWRMRICTRTRATRRRRGTRRLRRRRRRPRPPTRVSSSIRSWRSRWTPRRRSRPPPRGVDPRTRPRGRS